MIHQQTLTFQPNGRKILNISAEIAQAIATLDPQINSGLCNLFIQHTSASLTINENADPLVLADLENFMQRLVPDGDPLFQHVDEGEDDMPSHVRHLLTQTSLSIPIMHGQLALGRWQGIFLWEHRFLAHDRKIVLTVFS